MLIIKNDNLKKEKELKYKEQLILDWFEYYDRKILECQRCERLNIPCHHNINDLDNEAELKKAEINDIRKQLGEL